MEKNENKINKKLMLIFPIIVVISALILLSVFKIIPYFKVIGEYNAIANEINKKNSELDKEIKKLDELLNKGEKVTDEKVKINAKEISKKAGAKKRIVGKRLINMNEIIDETKKLKEPLDYSKELQELKDAYEKYNTSIKQYKQFINPTEEFIIQRLKTIDEVVDVKPVTEEHDPNGNLGKPGGYTATIYFESKNVDQEKLGYKESKNLIDKGTDAGGAIEVYANEEDAIKRRDYLATFDGGILANGTHTVIGTCLIRTSNELKSSQQKELEKKIIEVLSKI